MDAPRVLPFNSATFIQTATYWKNSTTPQPTIGDKTMNVDKELDAKGLSCPLPIVKTKKALNDMASGQILKVLSTDPGSVRDMEAFAKQTGNALVESTQENGAFVFFMRKK